MDHADDELHRAKRELDVLVARMQKSPHARTFLGYADAVVFSALRDLPREAREEPRVSTPQDIAVRIAGAR